MDDKKTIFKYVSKRELFLFISFYIVSSLIYYTATWITWGGLENGNPSFFNIEEFFAAAGTDFIISFILTIPIWYITIIKFNKKSPLIKYGIHVIFLPLFLLIGYHFQVMIKQQFGWAMFWGGKKVIWTYYNLMLFYLVQFSIIHAYHNFKQYKLEQTEKFELKEIALKNETVALKAQLNPHFLHNLFNSINVSIPPENEQTRELIVLVSDLFRYQNYAAQKEFVTIEEEINFIENYLILMKVRLKERLNYQIEFDRELNQCNIIPMLLQPLVENAVTHGISPKIAPSNLIISIFKKEQKINFTISDTGIGIKDKKEIYNKGIGLNNTQKRLKRIYQSDLIIEDIIPTGTKISFSI